MFQPDGGPGYPQWNQQCQIQVQGGSGSGYSPKKGGGIETTGGVRTEKGEKKNKTLLCKKL